MLYRIARIVFVLAFSACQLCHECHAEDPKPPAPKPAEIAPAAPVSDLFTDPAGGFTMKIPAGFARLNDEENREAFNRLSEHFGKEAGERALRQPPVRFRGQPDPKNPEKRPPAMTVTVSGLQWVIDPDKKAQYKDLIEEDYKKVGLRHGEITLDIVSVNGINSLRAEHDIFSPVDNSPEKIVMLIVPGSDRSFDIVFNFVADQSPQVNAALDTVIKSFKVESAPAVSQESMSRWTRILIWTFGCFAAGLLVSFLLRKLAGVNSEV